MKKLFALALFSIITFRGMAQTEEEIRKDFTGPVFEFEEEVINYGDVLKNSDGNRTFKFKNVGKSPLIIYSVQGSCGCTVPTKPEKPIMPGEQGEIKVHYDTKRVGPFSKTVTVKSNAWKPERKLYIKGRVLDKAEENTLKEKKSVVSEKN